MKSLRRYTLITILFCITLTVMATRKYTNIEFYISESQNPAAVLSSIGSGYITSNLTTDFSIYPQCQVNDSYGSQYYLFSGVDGTYYPIYPVGSW
jgi:hypothetical protein